MLKLLIVTLLSSTASSKLRDFGLPNSSMLLTRAVIDFILHSDFNASFTINMYHISQLENLKSNSDVMNEVLNHVQTEAIVQLDTSTDFKISSWKRVSNIIFVNSLEAFHILFNQIDYKRFEYQGYYLIVVTIHVSQIFFIALKIFEALWTKKIINANILFMSTGSDNEVSQYTYFPYANHYCESVIPIQLNQYTEHQWTNDIDYFPAKLTNFYGCSLRVATHSNPPFMIIKDNKNGTKTVDGMEGRLLYVLAQRFNFMVDLHVQKELFGTIYENGTTTGAIRMIVDHEANFTLGFFASLPVRDAIMQPSYVYYTTNILWVVPPGKPQSALEKLANPLEYLVWVLSLLTIAIGFLLIALIKFQPKLIQRFVFGNKTQSPGLNFINIILGNSLHQVPFRNFSRFLFIKATIYFFIIRTCYSGGLVNFMQMDTREQHMMSTAELLKENYTFYMKRTTFLYISNMPEVVERAVLLPVAEFNSKLQEVTEDPYYHGAFQTTSGHLAYRNSKVYPHNFHEFAPEPLYDLDIVIYMSLGSCLRDYFNDMLLKLLANGLIDKLESEFIDSKYLKRPVDNQLKSLSIQQLEGAFQLLVGGLLMGVVAFCGEMLVGKDVLKKFRRFKRFKFLKQKLKIHKR